MATKFVTEIPTCGLTEAQALLIKDACYKGVQQVIYHHYKALGIALAETAEHIGAST